MDDHGTRITRLEERFAAMSATVDDLRNGQALLMTGVGEADRIARDAAGTVARSSAAAARRERRFYAVGGLLLTAINVAVAISAVVFH